MTTVTVDSPAIEQTRPRDTSVGLPIGAILILVAVVMLNAFTLDAGDAQADSAAQLTVATASK